MNAIEQQMQLTLDFLHKSQGLLSIDLKQEKESYEYCAYTLNLDGSKSKFRIAKVTPTKPGLFVTMWKRNSAGITEPHAIHDPIDLYIVSVKDQNRAGVFIFPKEAFAKHGIISVSGKGGKRGFRVYPTWENSLNKQATKTQSWQVKYFYDFSKAD